MDRKRYLISDILHNPIMLTPIEKAIVGTPVFNRLHGVKQNSTAYLTYPAMTHTRFSHSLGAMELAGKMFHAGFLNADPTDRKLFLEHLIDYSERLLLSRLKTDNHRWNVLDREANRFYQCTSIKEASFDQLPVLDEAIPHFLDDKLLKYFYAVGYQAIRLAALVHDLGHPPFSHVTEYALIELVRYYGDSQTSGGKELRDSLRASDSSKASNPPHERLTLSLFESLKVELLRNANERGDSGIFRFEWLCFELAKAILDEDPGKAINSSSDRDSELLRCLHWLTAGELDADRLDYVQRDANLAGVREGGLRADRMIGLMQLTYVSREMLYPGKGLFEDHSQKLPRFLPSVRSIRSLEEFFRLRFDLYRSVIFHHHVIKTDALFQQAVEDMCIESIDGSSQHNVIGTSNGAPLSTLWTIFNEYNGEGLARLNQTYLQWDDHWLISMMRTRYLELDGKRHNSGLTDHEAVQLCRLEELVASKHNYLSLIKRQEHFDEIERHLEQAILSQKNEVQDALRQYSQKFESAARKYAPSITRVENVLTGCHSSQDNGNYSIVRDILSLVTPIMDKKEFLKNISTEAQREFYFGDCVIKEKPISTGLNPEFVILADTGPVRLDQVSGIGTELSIRCEKWPGFFIFVLPKSIYFSGQDSQTRHNIDPIDLRKQFARLMLRSFISIFAR
ncbi:MAG: hypothetical protein EG825_04680 [Rhodocyclaceae bacterium]|nr:hypothetical protein [Rhodocyclaceae bacterium]